MISFLDSPRMGRINLQCRPERGCDVDHVHHACHREWLRVELARHAPKSCHGRHLFILHFGLGTRRVLGIWTSTSWDSAPEIIALTMNSHATERLHNTGAGIDTVKPFQQKVKIRYRDGHLEYVFRDTVGGSSCIRPNREYA
jgi:hypothetical protein